MAAGLNVIPMGNISNTYAQQYSQALRNLQVGRAQYLAATAVIAKAFEAVGGSATDLAAVFGTTAAQAQILHDESVSFRGQLTGAGLVAAWDQINAIMGIVV